MQLAARIGLGVMALVAGVGCAFGAIYAPDAIRSDLQVGPAFFLYGALPLSLLVAASIFASPATTEPNKRDGGLIAGGGAVAGTLTLIGLTHWAPLAWPGVVVAALTCGFLVVRSRAPRVS